MIVGNAIEVNGELSALYMGKLQIFREYEKISVNKILL